MMQRLLERIKFAPEKQGPPRALFGILAAVMALFLLIDIVRAAAGHGQPLWQTIGLAGLLLLMIFFFSRQPQVRLVSYFAAMALLAFSIFCILRHLAQSFL
jgi:hypothetical protein